MLFSNPSQFVVLGLVFFIGLIFAFVIHPGGRKWKNLYQEEVEDNAAYRNDADHEIRAARKRIAELEKALEQKLSEAAPISLPEAPSAPQPVWRMAETAPVDAVPVDTAPVEAVPAEAAAPVVIEAAPIAEAAPVAEVMPAHETVEAVPLAVIVEPKQPDDAKKAWLGAAGYNDLTRIRGIDSVLNNRLFGLGVTRFADIEKLSAEDEIALEQRLNVPAGFIAREQWRDQAALLRAGNNAEHEARFGSTNVTA
ncbi:hypothetical protein GCM10009087_34770 [Sphingomonas oligophenolica]|uniref:Flap endonuclease-1-like 5' DNA nuclease n=1 Tax=Sphingomonas oligophenolica TaxID=301154 RepID=A0ABU9XZ01_9SPHN